MSSTPSVAVIVPTYRRPQHLKECLAHLAEQAVLPTQIAVVDASPDEESRRVVDEFPGVLYLRNELGAGSTATSRAIGVAATQSDIVAFLDDDAYADPRWLSELVVPYTDETVGGVGGRASNGIPGEEHEGLDRIGRLLQDGTLTGFFAADPGHDVEVDHLLGANMSLRRSALEAVGGLRDYYPGTCLREETDPALRVRNAGWRLVYRPRAIVRHVAGPYAKGKRFDLRYVYYGQRNHVVLLTVTGCHAELRSYAWRGLRDAGGEVQRAMARAVALMTQNPLRAVRSVISGFIRGCAVLAGLGSGVIAALRARSSEARRVNPAPV